MNLDVKQFKSIFKNKELKNLSNRKKNRKRRSLSHESTIKKNNEP